jgi:hypothetical protein
MRSQDSRTGSNSDHRKVKHKVKRRLCGELKGASVIEDMDMPSMNGDNRVSRRAT